ncbi:sialidase family protein [Phytoactinopolyspora mesophila]|uniref:Neuraminidase (Sialidase) n=1 Tax=Phytoactinopolyspora mesophila TaxID=2650750 RepID=A0A7K3MCZ6_9ACTN|nr:sialidase family protein [Phytoactinopolyspora mesophila]NDL61070.1 neuraminidase (sialidase) [Phytoactinopolyspora mesophila]
MDAEPLAAGLTATGHWRSFVVRDFSAWRQCHAPTVADAGGHLVVAWFAGEREGAPDSSIWLARGHGSAWSAPQRVAAHPGEPCWNPVLFTAAGQLLLFYKVGSPIPAWRTMVMTSGDGGRTWSAARELVGGDRGGRGPVKNKPIVLSNGDWLAPGSTEGEWWDAFVDRSNDDGRTWQRTFLPLDHEAHAGQGVIQPTLWESAPGHVHALLRSTNGWVCRSDSVDGGRSWSPVLPTGLPSNNSGLDAVRLADGRVVVVHNPVGQAWGARTPLVVSISADDGHTWRRVRTLEDAPAPTHQIVGEPTGVVTDGVAEFSYPAVIPYGGGVAVVYTWQRRGIAFAHLTNL